MSAIEKAIPGETGQGYADFATFQDPLPSLPGAKKVNSYPEYDSSLTICPVTAHQRGMVTALDCMQQWRLQRTTLVFEIVF